MRAIFLSFLAITLGVVATTNASAAVQLTGFDKRLCAIDPETSSVLVPGWTAPIIRKDGPGISYPRDELRMYGEGVVQLHLIVGADGRVRHASVVDSVGPSTFRQFSLDAAKAFLYTPATLNGKPIEARVALTIAYAIDGDRDRMARHTHFLKFYDKGRKLLAEGKPREAIEELNKVFGTWTNMYEVAMTSSILAKAHYELKEYDQAMLHVGHATLEDNIYLNDGMAPPAMRLRMKLAADAGDHREALCTYLRARDLKMPKTEAPGPVSRAEADAIAKASLAALASPEPLRLSATIDANGAWSASLERPRFVFEGAPANMPFALTCIAAYVENVAAPGKEYQTPPDAGPCSLSVEGKPGTRFMVRVMH